jgi:uncharacterized membrane protein YdjX (TVP38/TMEM64 family)
VLRLAALIGGVLVLAGTGAWLEHAGAIDTHTIAGGIRGLGGWAIPLFFVTCIAGELLHLPGMLFVVAAQLVFGRGAGLAIAYAGAVLGVATAFALARVVRGRAGAHAPRRLPWAWAQRLLDGLDRHPIATIVLLRSVFWISPPLNYALGWSRVRARDYLIGSAIGLVVPVTLIGLVLARVA